MWNRLINLELFLIATKLFLPWFIHFLTIFTKIDKHDKNEMIYKF